MQSNGAIANKSCEDQNVHKQQVKTFKAGRFNLD